MSRYVVHEEGGQVTGHLSQFLAVTLLSSMLVVQKSLLSTWSPRIVVTVQFSVAAIVGWLCLLLFTGLPSRSLPFGKAILFGIIAPGGTVTLSTLGAAQTDAVSMVVIWGLAPLVAPLAGRLFLGEKVRLSAYTGALIGFALVIWLVNSRQVSAEGSLTGNLLVLAAILCSTISQVLGRVINRGSRYPSLSIAVLQLSGAAITGVSATVIATLIGVVSVRGAEMTPSIAMQFVYIIVPGTFITFWLYNVALSHLPVAFLSLYITLVPAFGSILAAVFLGAELSWSEVLAVAGIVAAVALPSIDRIRGSRAPMLSAK
ncbi:MAG: DMT family transporter [Gammaproteobacteria bacterium]|nr:DMT family transporter [Gammaproteobacteria bacterium]